MRPLMTVVLSFASTAVAVSSVVLHSSFSTFKAHGAVSDIANHGFAQYRDVRFSLYSRSIDAVRNVWALAHCDSTQMCRAMPN